MKRKESIKKIIKEDYFSEIEGALIEYLDSPKSVEATEPTLKKDNYKEYYSDIIHNYDILIDKDCGITNQYIKDKNNEIIRIRDARGSNAKKPEESAYSWMQTIASQARAASILLELGGGYTNKEEIEEHILELFNAYKNALNNAKNASDRKHLVNQFSYEMIETLRKNDIYLNNELISETDNKKIHGALNEIRDFGNFEETHHSTVTIAQTKTKEKKTVVWASKKVNPVSETIAEEYNDAIKDPTNAPQWFQDLTPTQKELTRTYKDKIISGKYVIPTQLRFLPGIKNAFIDLKGFIANDNTIDPNYYIEAHSGTMAHNAGNSTGDEVDRLTKLNIAHAQTLVSNNNGCNLAIQVLNSNVRDINPTDRNICSAMKTAAESLKIDYEQRGINLTSKPGVLGGMDKMTKRANRINNEDTKILWTMCKSGKDRTFAMLLKNVSGVLPNKKRELTDAFLHANIAETMAGSSGATRGAHALKLSPAYLRWNFKIPKLNIKLWSLPKDHALGGNTEKHWDNKLSSINNIKEEKVSESILNKKNIASEREIENNDTTKEKHIYYHQEQSVLDKKDKRFTHVSVMIGIIGLALIPPPIGPALSIAFAAIYIATNIYYYFQKEPPSRILEYNTENHNGKPNPNEPIKLNEIPSIHLSKKVEEEKRK